MNTKKHFELMAKTISKVADLTDRKKMAELAISVYKKENPRFNKTLFLSACNLGESK